MHKFSLVLNLGNKKGLKKRECSWLAGKGMQGLKIGKGSVVLGVGEGASRGVVQLAPIYSTCILELFETFFIGIASRNR